MAAVYRSGDYSKKEIADYCVMHLSIMSHLVSRGLINHEYVNVVYARLHDPMSFSNCI